VFDQVIHHLKGDVDRFQVGGRGSYTREAAPGLEIVAQAAERVTTWEATEMGEDLSRGPV